MSSGYDTSAGVKAALASFAVYRVYTTMSGMTWEAATQSALYGFIRSASLGIMGWLGRHEALVERVVGKTGTAAAIISGATYRPTLPDGTKVDVPSKSLHPHKSIDVMKDDIKILRPFTLAGLTLKNRVIRAAAFDGSKIEEIVATHESVAKGGVGMTVVAYCCVSRDGRSFEEQIDLTDHKRSAEVLRPVVEACHKHGAAICAQLTHGGGFADRHIHGTQNVGPSAVFNPAGIDFPRECTEEDMKRLEDDFVQGAKFVVQELGFDAVELHCGHGYLLSQWLSPLLNCRTDEYGGSPANRARFPLRILAAIRKALGPAVPILVKMNAQDGVKSGLELSDAIVAARMFAEYADMLVISCGLVGHNAFYLLRGTTPIEKLIIASQGIKRVLCFFLGFFSIHTTPYDDCFLRDSARVILKEVGNLTNVCLLGGVSSLTQMEGAIDEGFAAVQMARPFIREPDFLHRIQREVAEERERITSSLRAFDSTGDSSSEFDVATKCIRCNQCVIASIDPNKDLGCPFRRLEEAAAQAQVHNGKPTLSISPTMARSIVKDIEDIRGPRL